MQHDGPQPPPGQHVSAEGQRGTEAPPPPPPPAPGDRPRPEPFNVPAPGGGSRNGGKRAAPKERRRVPGLRNDNDRDGQGEQKSGENAQGLPKWSVWVLLLLVLGVLLFTTNMGGSEPETLSYSEFRRQVAADEVSSIKINNDNGKIEGELSNGDEFKSQGPNDPPERDLELYEEHNVDVVPFTRETSLLEGLLPLLLPVALLIGFFWWMQRRAQGQMSGIMSIGRSKAKTYSTERPGTTFADVAGYEGVKQEITEVVDFLKRPERFGEIGARIPKGILLVGPPGTGKTLLAKAVAGEAGVPFMSVTGSDFMEMFVGVGASRVRDLFDTARKLGRAIIFIDEIDSIGRKRGAGLGGGHDEREQTLNQMLAEMDGFEATEGIVMMAATNRPDILDPALLRAGRFDRQVIVPLPEVSERLEILKVHAKDKKMADDVRLDLVAKGSPGMAGADLANLINEAALYAVRRGDDEVHQRDIEDARDRVLVGQRRESVMMTDEEKESTAYHEGGHALVAAVLNSTDPVHKVSILPTGMALGVTQTLPEERHSMRQDHIEDALAMMLGGRIAEEVVYGVVSTGASDDLRRATELARRMVREWGMSDRIGPMAWGNQGAVFLGEDLMHSKDYSDETARVVDEEVERILREQQVRTRGVVREHREGLERIARALLAVETISGEEVALLISGELDVERIEAMEQAGLRQHNPSPSKQNRVFPIGREPVPVPEPTEIEADNVVSAPKPSETRSSRFWGRDK